MHVTMYLYPEQECWFSYLPREDIEWSDEEWDDQISGRKTRPVRIRLR